MSPPSPATAGRTRVSSNSLIWATISWSSGHVLDLSASRRPRSPAAGDEVVHDRGEHLRLQRRPVDIAGLGHRDEVAAQEYTGHARQVEQGARQRAASAVPGRRSPPWKPHDVAAGQEFESGGIRCVFGLDENGSRPAVVVERKPDRHGPVGDCYIGRSGRNDKGWPRVAGRVQSAAAAVTPPMPPPSAYACTAAANVRKSGGTRCRSASRSPGATAHRRRIRGRDRRAWR